MAGFSVAPDVATVEAADELPDMLEEGKRLAAELGLVNVAFTLVDLYSLPYKDGAFTLVVCRNAFHLLPEPVTALAELQRVLSPAAASSCSIPSWTRRPTRPSTRSRGCASRRTAGTTGRRARGDRGARRLQP